MTNRESSGQRSRFAITPQGEQGRTIEEIEARAAEILTEERRALAALIACIREIAVRCPAESRLPLDLAKAAKTLELWTSADNPSQAIGCAIGPYGHLSSAIDTYMPRGGDE